MFQCVKRYFQIFQIPTDFGGTKSLPFFKDLGKNVRQYVLADILGGVMGKGKDYGVGFLETTPDTSASAIVCDWRDVTNARVVELKNAFYRGSIFSGTFELADKADPFFEGHDGLRVEIKLHWYGRRLKTRWARVLVGSKRPKIKTGYSGKVGWDLGEP